MGNPVYGSNLILLTKFSKVNIIKNLDIVNFYISNSFFPYNILKFLSGSYLYIDFVADTDIGKFIIKLFFPIENVFYFLTKDEVKDYLKAKNINITKRYIIETYDNYSKYIDEKQLLDVFNSHIYEIY
jgi:hypothetical protein